MAALSARAGMRQRISAPVGFQGASRHFRWRLPNQSRQTDLDILRPGDPGFQHPEIAHQPNICTGDAAQVVWYHHGCFRDNLLHARDTSERSVDLHAAAFSWIKVSVQRHLGRSHFAPNYPSRRVPVCLCRQARAVRCAGSGKTALCALRLHGP